MSNLSPRTHEAETHATDAEAQRQAEYLPKRLESITLNDPQSNVGSQEEPKKKVLSARDLLEKLSRRRLKVTQISFAAGSTQVGKGSHGEVVIGTLSLEDSTSSEAPSQVAVKKFLISENIDEEKFLRAFTNELRVLDELDHPNIIRIIGFVENVEKRIAWLEANGNVREFLLSGEWELRERVSSINDVALGLNYLHTRKPPIRHGDLKSLNILVNSDHRAVITDFGSARIHGFETTSDSPPRQATLTKPNIALNDGSPEVNVNAASGELTLTGPSWSFRWAAPEILNEEESCLASDIWALGWIAWEVVTDNYPIPEAKTNKSITINVVMGNLPQLYHHAQLSQVGILCYLMIKCWKSEPKERPSAPECQSVLQSLPSIIPRARGDGVSQVRSAALMVEMGYMHQLQCRHKEALNFFEEASALARSTGNKAALARALSLIAESQRLLSSYDEAEAACQQSLDVYTSLGNNYGCASVLLQLGDIHEVRFNFANAEECYNEALSIFTSFEDNTGRATALQRLGSVHQAQCNYAKSEEVFNQALDIFTSIGDSYGQASALRGLGDTHQAQSNHATAEEYFKQALGIFTGIGYILGEANALLRLGQILQARSNHAEAEEYFKQALAVYTRIGDSLGRATALFSLGKAHQARFSYSDAEELFNEALFAYGGLGTIAAEQGRSWGLVKSYSVKPGILSPSLSFMMQQSSHARSSLNGLKIGLRPF